MNPIEQKNYQQVERIKTDLRKAQQEGQLRAERIREIVRSAMSEATVEFKQGSGEIRSIAREVFAAVLESLQGRGKEVRDEVTASIEGIVDGISHSRREAIVQSQTEVNQLQSQIEAQEAELNTEIAGALGEIESAAKTSGDLRSMIETAVASLQESEEAALLRKRYAQLQTQLAILKANLAARYGDRYDEMKHHLDEAKVWYRDAQEKAHAADMSVVEQKQAEFERKMGEAGSAIARKEKQVKQILKELWHEIVDIVRDDKNSRQ